MSVRHLGPALAAALAPLLRPQGYRRSGVLFSRAREGFEELFAIDGSQWNSGIEPWRFDLHVGVVLAGVPPFPGPGGRSLRARAHARSGVGEILEGDPFYEVSQATVDAVAARLQVDISACSERLEALLEPIRPRAALGLFSPLPLPSTWWPLDGSVAPPSGRR